MKHINTEIISLRFFMFHFILNWWWVVKVLFGNLLKLQDEIFDNVLACSLHKVMPCEFMNIFDEDNGKCHHYQCIAAHIPMRKS